MAIAISHRSGLLLIRLFDLRVLLSLALWRMVDRMQPLTLLLLDLFRLHSRLLLTIHHYPNLRQVVPYQLQECLLALVS